LWTAGIPSRGGKMYDPEVSDGYILVGVENPSDSSKLEPALALAGARVKKTQSSTDFTDYTDCPTYAWSPIVEIAARDARLGRAPGCDQGGQNRMTSDSLAVIRFWPPWSQHGRRPFASRDLRIREICVIRG